MTENTSINTQGTTIMILESLIREYNQNVNNKRHKQLKAEFIISKLQFYGVMGMVIILTANLFLDLLGIKLYSETILNIFIIADFTILLILQCILIRLNIKNDKNVHKHNAEYYEATKKLLNKYHIDCTNDKKTEELIQNLKDYRANGSTSFAKSWIMSDIAIPTMVSVFTILASKGAEITSQNGSFVVFLSKMILLLFCVIFIANIMFNYNKLYRFQSVNKDSITNLIDDIKDLHLFNDFSDDDIKRLKNMT